MTQVAFLATIFVAVFVAWGWSKRARLPLSYGGK